MEKYITWQRITNRVYKRVNFSDDAMITLSLFIEDGLGSSTYISFLEDKGRQEFSGNISLLEKQGRMVTILLDDTIFPGLPDFTTTVDNLILILKELRKLKEEGHSIIKLILNHDILIITTEQEF